MIKFTNVVLMIMVFSIHANAEDRQKALILPKIPLSYAFAAAHGAIKAEVDPEKITLEMQGKKPVWKFNYGINGTLRQVLVDGVSGRVIKKIRLQEKSAPLRRIRKLPSTVDDTDKVLAAAKALRGDDGPALGLSLVSEQKILFWLVDFESGEVKLDGETLKLSEAGTSEVEEGL
ncbi:MAG: PepSY domain-containing protein [Candidatus Wallbacteria bacterium]|nr:PepSY domain-containing protein [Candidatus Wallbacteria bacterium]